MTVNYYAPFGDGTYWRNITDTNDTTYGQIAIIDGKRKLVVGDKIGELCLVDGKRRYWVEANINACIGPRRYLHFRGMTYIAGNSEPGISYTPTCWYNARYESSSSGYFFCRNVIVCNPPHYNKYYVSDQIYDYYPSQMDPYQRLRASWRQCIIDCSTGVKTTDYGSSLYENGITTTYCSVLDDVTGDDSYIITTSGEQLGYTELELMSTGQYRVRYSSSGDWIIIPSYSRSHGCYGW